MDVNVLGFLVAGALYASVGHGGASGYLAVMALASFAPEPARMIALLCNIPVAAIAFFNYRAHLNQPKLLWALLVLAVPMAYIGGSYRLPPHVYALFLSLALLSSAVWLLIQKPDLAIIRNLPTLLALPLGAVLGLLAGLTGIGGGVFLSPLLILGRFSTAQQAAPIAAAFILLNSSAGLAAQTDKLVLLPANTLTYVLSAVIGGFVGSFFAAKTRSRLWIVKLLALVLLIAALKLASEAVL